jgi:biotin operon repressor
MGDENFQLEDEDRNGTCPFIMVHGPELADGRLSDGEKILLFWLRLRSRSTKGKNTWVSWQTIAEDLGINESTVKRRARKLRKLGWIRCEARGYAKSKTKLLRRASSMYDDGLWSWDFWEKCVHDRTDEQINELRSIGGKNDPNEDQGDIDNADQAHIDNADQAHIDNTIRVKNDPSIRVKNDPSLGSEMTQRNKSKESNKSEEDSPRSARRRTQPPAESYPNRTVGFEKGTPYDGVTGEVLEPKALASDLKKTKGETLADEDPSVISEADGDDRLDAAVLIAAQAGSSAYDKAKGAIAKTEAKKAAKEASGEAQKEREWKRATKAQTMTIKAQLEEFMTDTFKDWFPDAIMGKFGGPEYGKLNHLLRIYDNDVVFIRKAWKSLCSNWEEIQKRLKIKDSVPTVGIFLGMRESIFAIVQETKTTRQEQESKKLSGKFEW